MAKKKILESDQISGWLIRKAMDRMSKQVSMPVSSLVSLQGSKGWEKRQKDEKLIVKSEAEEEEEEKKSK